MMSLFLFTALLTVYYANLWGNVAFGADTQWTVIATSPYYVNYRMTTETNFRQRYIPKALPKVWAHMDCATSCTADKNCSAFSFYEKDDYYAGDLAGDNYCTNKTGKALVNYNGSAVWDKINTGMTTGCFKPAPIPCETIRPGCSGFYPNYTQCLKSCVDCWNRYSYTNGYRNCTLWPDGDGPDSDPVAVLCYYYYTILVNRKVNSTTGEITKDFRISFENISRIHNPKIYPYLQFDYALSTGSTYRSLYKVAAIASDGTLTNITNYSGYNILALSANISTILKFSTVTNDTYGCGSFWLLDPNNATYCPGGAVRMFGTPIFNGSNLISTGIHFGNIYPNSIFVEATLYLSL